MNGAESLMRTARDAESRRSCHNEHMVRGRLSMTLTTTEIDQLVSLERGEVDRRVYSDPTIFELEMDRIFARSVAVPLPRVADSRTR